MSWKGTPVPNSGLVENVYFNTNLSVEEVKTLLDTLSFDGNGVYPVIGVMVRNEPQVPVAIYKSNNEYAILTAQGFIFATFISEEDGITEMGWANEVIASLGNPLDFSIYGELEYLNEVDGMAVGNQNDKLSSLFSITPFEEVQEEVTLDSWAEDIADAIREKKEITTGNWGGKTVPNSGTVDKLYFNDKVSFQEIYNLLSSIEYAPYDDNGFFEVYIALNCDGGSSFGVIKKNNTDTPRGIEYDINVDDELFWTSVNDEGFTSYGLNVLATQQNYGYIPNTGEALDKDSIGNKEYEVGLQNDKLSSLISTSPFFRKIPRLNFAQEIRDISTGTDTSDATATASDILQGKTAYTSSGKVEGTIETYNGENEGGVVGGGTIKEGTTVPNNTNKEVDFIYFNKSKTPQEWLEVINQLTFYDVSSMGLENEIYPIACSGSIISDLTFAIWLEKTNDETFKIVYANLGKSSYFDLGIINSEGMYMQDMLIWLQYHYPLLMDMLPIGTQNELLKDFISITPFKE